MLSRSNQTVTLIGAGNVAVYLGKALHKAGYSIREVYSRTQNHAQALASVLGAVPVWSPENIDTHSNFYIFSLKDDSLPEVLASMPPVNGIYIHTSGSTDMNIFKPCAKNYGVCYPLQTFSKNREINFATIPLFIEGSNPDVESQLLKMAMDLSGQVTILSSEKRKFLHLSAVFACNFSNHMYTLASSILEAQELPWQYLLPLIGETAAKVTDMHPKEAQTGPAVRNDQTIMQKQLELLTNENTRELYRVVSRGIDSLHKKEDD